ncbi:DUF2252 family protein [bacterium]|nr:DUF2252 family protein [bacterium]
MKISKIFSIMAISVIAFCGQSFATNTDITTVKPCVYIAKVTDKTKVTSQNIVNRISEYHKNIGLDSKQTKKKFKKILKSPARFYQASPVLFYEDLFDNNYKISENSPYSIICADPHTGNFGIMPDKNGNVVWGPNDFDLSGKGKVEWDLMRLGASIKLASKRDNIDKDAVKPAITALIRGYKTEAEKISKNGNKNSCTLTDKEVTNFIKKEMDDAETITEKEFTKKKFEKQNGKLSYKFNKKTIKLTQKQENRIRKIIVDLGKKKNIELEPIAFCEKLGSGGSTYGLKRYRVYSYIPKEKKYVEIEIKQILPSVLDKDMIKKSGYLKLANAKNIVKSIKEVGGVPYDRFSESCKLDGFNFMTRERYMLDADDTDDFKTSDDLKNFAYSAGIALARTHCRTKEKGAEITNWLNTEKNIVDNLYDFSVKYADITNKYYKELKKVYRDKE